MVARSQFWVLVPAAGRGLRMGADIPKQYLSVAGRSVLEHSLSLFLGHARIAGVVVALAANDQRWAALETASSSRVHVVTGGAERSLTVLAGLEYLMATADANDWVLVHDAARPCLSLAMLDRLLSTLEHDPVGGLLAIPTRDTIKQARDGRVALTLDRDRLWQAQTPQMFRVGALHVALGDALRAGRRVTDEASAMEQAGHAPRLVEGGTDNLKITRPEDLALAGYILEHRSKR